MLAIVSGQAPPDLETPVRPTILSLLLATLLPFASSCDEAKSQQCKDVCQQETDCAEQQNRNGESFPYDLDECVAACVGLERDTHGQEKVKAHVECARRAGDSCEELMKCR